MKFLCPSCKAKYQIADEKIAGRTLKMECRRCNHQITIRGDSSADFESMDVAEPPSARATASRSGAGALRPAGSARGSSSVGLSPARPAAPQAPQRSALGADFRRTSVATEAAAPARAAPVEQWHVAINDVPVGPMRRDEIARKVAMGAITGDSLSWREGFDDWRPVRDVPELAALLRRATPEPRGGGLGPGPRTPAPGARSIGPARGGPGAPRPAADIRASARASVVPIGGRLGAAAAPAIDEDEDPSQEEATTIASAADLGLVGFGADPIDERLAPAKAEPAKAKGLPAPRAAISHKPIAAPAAKPEPATKTPSSARSAPAPAAAEGRQSSPTGEISFDAPVFVAPAPAAAPVVFATPAPQGLPAIATTESAPPARRGLPVGAWMGIAGVMTFAAVFALIAAQRFLPPPVAAATPAPAVAVAAALPIAASVEHSDPTPPVVAEDPVPPVVAAEAPAVAPTVAPTSPPTAAPHRGTTSGSSGAAASGSSGAAAHPGTSGGADLSRFADEGTGSSGPTGLAARPSGGSSGGGGGPSAELTEDQIRTVVNRERTGLTRCWETAIRGMRETPTVRLEVEMTIGSSGTVTAASARGPTVGTLTECIERNVRHWRFPASGGTSRTTFPVVFTGTS